MEIGITLNNDMMAIFSFIPTYLTTMFVTTAATYTVKHPQPCSAPYYTHVTALPMPPSNDATCIVVTAPLQHLVIYI